MFRVVLSLLLASPVLLIAENSRPNIVVIFTDDQGYNDLGCFGSKMIKTPNIDRMAAEGMKFTSFYAQAVCGPSRAALMTGCYPIRVGEPGNKKNQHTILHPKEVTMAEVLKGAGYATGCIGKWHLGQRAKGGQGWDPATMPNGQGFDYYYGTPLYNGFTVYVKDTKFRSPILRNQEVVTEAVESWDDITADYTKEAVGFIREHRDEPFFLYLAHNMPHIPVGASERFKGKSEYGPYGDTIEEIDWSTGEILKTLKALGIDENTLVVFTSDNGPWIETTRGMQPGIKPFIPANHSGTADPLRGFKMLTWEGGLRVPCVMRWPGRIPAGRSTGKIAATIDLLPTFARLAGVEVPSDRKLDGVDISVLWSNPAASPREEMRYYCFTHLQALRTDRWKLVLPRPAHPAWVGWSGRFVNNGVQEPELYDLKHDHGEAKNVAAANPKVLAELMKRVAAAREDAGDYDRIGKHARFFDEAPKRPEIGRWASAGKPKAPTKVPADLYKKAEPVGDLGFDFEDGMQGWRVVEGGFEALRNKRANFHHAFGGAKYNKQGEWFLTTLERKAGGRGNDSQTGLVESPVFKVTGKRASLLVGGGKHANTYVALVNAADGKELMKARGRSAERMYRVNWDLSKLKGQQVFLRLVDRNKGGWGHVTLDDFSAEAELDAEATAKRWAALKNKPKKPAARAWKRPATTITHSFLATGAKTYIMGADGRIKWESPLKSRDGWVLPNGNVLLAVSKGGPYKGGAVVEVTREGKKVFEFKGTQAEVNTAQLLENGNILLTEAGPKPRLLEVTRESRIAVEVRLKCQVENFHMQSRMARKLANGNYLVPQLHDKVVREYSKKGEVVWEVATPHWPFTAIRLPNGNTLINCTYGHISIEVDPKGKTVWQLSNDDLPAPLIKDACGAQRLPNGNTVITCYGNRGKNVKLLEVTRDKQLVWVYEDEFRHGIHHFQILDTNGRPIADPLK